MKRTSGGSGDGKDAMHDRDLRNWLTTKADPSVRLRVYTELLDRSADDPPVIKARRQIGKEGWAASILARQLPDGQWSTPSTEAGSLYRPVYAATNSQLLVLADLGVTREDPRVAKGAELLLERWDSALGGKSSHLCITGNAVRMMQRLGYGDDLRVQRAVAWLLKDQKKDGGWHCFPSKSGTIDSWEALGAFAAIPKESRSAAVNRAIERGAEFYLDRKLMAEGAGRYEPWFRLHYPNHYFYDVLVGLDLITSLGYASDRRLGPALDWLESRRTPDGRWTLDALHPDVARDPDATADRHYPTDLPENSPYGIQGIQPPYFSLGLELPGHPSRWITTTALTVLRRAGRN